MNQLPCVLNANFGHSACPLVECPVMIVRLPLFVSRIFAGTTKLSAPSDAYSKGTEHSRSDQTLDSGRHTGLCPARHGTRRPKGAWYRSQAVIPR